MKMEVSVVIVTWNSARFIVDCLESLITQLPVDSEVIVVDNASSDPTIYTIRAKFPSVKVIENKANLGFARANNLGIAFSTGQYICFINPDVVVGNLCIGRMRQFMDRNTDIGILGPRIIGSDGAVQRSCMRTPTLWNQLCRALAFDNLTKHSRLFGGYLMKDFLHNNVRDVDVINGCLWMARRRALDQVGMLDPRFWMYGEDLDWCRRYRDAGWRVVFYPESEALHFGGGSSERTPLLCCIEMLRADLQYWQKYHSFISYCSYFAILYLGHVIRLAVLAFLYGLRVSRRSSLFLRMKNHLACMHWLRSYASQANREASSV